jgi:hypothetical protein
VKTRLFLWLSALILPALVPNLVAADTANTCPVTTAPNPPFVPPAPYPPNAGQGAFWHGTPGLWTNLGVEGIWRALPRRENGYFNKLFLWQQGYDWRKEPQPDIIVVVRRLDAEAPLVSSRGGTNAIMGKDSAMLTGVTFPTEGCWEVTSYHEGHTLTFVVSVQP